MGNSVLTMDLLVSSFKEHLGTRGVHFYSDCECRFLTWTEIVNMVANAKQSENLDFYDRLLETLANYNPDCQFLALHHEDSEVSIELFSKISPSPSTPK